MAGRGRKYVAVNGEGEKVGFGYIDTWLLDQYKSVVAHVGPRTNFLNSIVANGHPAT